MPLFPFHTCALPENCKRIIAKTSAKNSGFLHFDSRKISDADTSIFVALKTEARDGHNYIVDAYAKGCRMFIVSHTEFVPSDADYICCDDTLKLLQWLAIQQRYLLNYPILAISGSNGKTVVKEWLLELIHPEKKVVYSPKSHNSQLGVAMSVLSATETGDLGIFEAGISKPHEMENLEAMLKPTYGILTNIGSSHSENFRSQTDLLIEKLKLYTGCQYIIYPKNLASKYGDTIKRQLLHCKHFVWGANDADITIDFTQGKASFGKKHIEFTAPKLSDLWLENLGNCIAFALLNNLCDDYFCRQIGQLKNIENRLTLHNSVGSNFILNDSYSLDINSLEEAIAYFNNQVKHEKKLLVLSQFDAHHLKTHEKALEIIMQADLDHVVFIGDFWRNLNIGLPPSNFDSVSTQEEALELCKNYYASHSMLFKGARIWQVENIVDALLKYGNRSYLEINLAAIKRNVHALKNKLPKECKLLGMLKAEAYGSGLQRIAKTLQNAGVDYFGVAYTQEAIALRESGVRLPILVIHPFKEDVELALRYNLELCAYSLDLLDHWKTYLKASNQKLGVHLEIETGMHRQGLTLEELKNLNHSTLKNFTIKGTMSHLAEGSDFESKRTKQQIETFESALTILNQQNIDPGLRHLLNTDGVQNYSGNAYDMARSGIGLFGWFSEGEFTLKLASKISKISSVKAGSKIGYGPENTVKKDSNIALVPLGYADALPYNVEPQKFAVRIHGKNYPLAANVCMDMIMVNLGSDNAEVGDDVDIIYDKKSLKQLSKASNTIPYEILSRFSQRISRIFIDE